MTRLTRDQIQPIIERLARINDHGWTFSELALMAYTSEVEDLTRSIAMSERESRLLYFMAQLQRIATFDGDTVTIPAKEFEELLAVADNAQGENLHG